MTINKPDKEPRDLLTPVLRTYWFAPPVALWRAIELRAAAQVNLPRPLLDLGCGDGLIARVLFEGEPPVEAGFDPWSAQLRRALASGAYRHVERAVGHQMPYASESFGSVFSNSVLEHIPDVAPVIHEAGRVLRSGGRFAFTVPSDAFRDLLDGTIRRAEAGDEVGAEAYAASVDRRLAHYHYQTPEEWADLLDQAGMELVSAGYYMPREVERFWDRANARYGIGQGRSLWSVLASPRLRSLGFQGLLRRLVVRRLSRLWRPHYEQDVADGEKGGGLLIVAQRKAT